MDNVEESVRAVCVEAVYNLSAGNDVSEDVLDTIGQLPSSSHIPYYYTVLNSHLEMLNGDPILSMLDIESVTLAEAFNAITEKSCSSKVELHALLLLSRQRLSAYFAIYLLVSYPIVLLWKQYINCGPMHDPRTRCYNTYS